MEDDEEVKMSFGARKGQPVKRVKEETVASLQCPRRLQTCKMEQGGGVGLA